METERKRTKRILKSENRKQSKTIITRKKNFSVCCSCFFFFFFFWWEVNALQRMVKKQWEFDEEEMKKTKTIVKRLRHRTVIFRMQRRFAYAQVLLVTVFFQLLFYLYSSTLSVGKIIRQHEVCAAAYGLCCTALMMIINALEQRINRRNKMYTLQKYSLSAICFNIIEIECKKNKKNAVFNSRLYYRWFILSFRFRICWN